MAKTSTVTLSATIIGDGGSLSYTPPGGLGNTAAPTGGPIPTALLSGDNTIAVPTGSQWVMIVPPSTSAVVKKIKGAGADAGITIAAALPTLLGLATAQTSLIVNAASGETVALLWL